MANWIVGSVVLAVVGGVLVLACVFAFAMSAAFLGHSHQEYRCNGGVLEKRQVFWNVGLGVFDSVNGQSICTPAKAAT